MLAMKSAFLDESLDKIKQMVEREKDKDNRNKLITKVEDYLKNVKKQQVVLDGKSQNTY